MEFVKETKDGKIVVRLIGELDTAAAGELQPEFSELISAATGDIEVNCEKLEYIASSGLRLLISLHKAVRAAGHKMCVTNVHPDVMEVFQITHLDKMISIEQMA